MSTSIKVGLPMPGLPAPLPEGSQLHVQDAEVTLLLIADNPAHAEVEGVRAGTIRVGLLIEPEFVALPYKIEGFGDGEATFAAGLLGSRFVQTPLWQECPEDKGAMLSVFLLNARDAVVRAIRVVGLGSKITKALWSACHAQTAKTFDRIAYEHAIETFERRYPKSSSAMAAARANGRSVEHSRGEGAG